MQYFRLNWQLLSQESRTAWNHAASSVPHTNRLGVTSRLTGFQLFISINFPTKRIGPVLAYQNPPQNLIRTIPIVDVDITFEAGGPYEFFINPADHPFGSDIILYIDRPVSNSVINSFKHWRFLGIKKNQAFNYNWQTEIHSTVGELTENETIGLKALHTISGFMPSLIWSGQTTVIP